MDTSKKNQNLADTLQLDAMISNKHRRGQPCLLSSDIFMKLGAYTQIQSKFHSCAWMLNHK